MRSADEPSDLDQRVASLLEVAALHRTGVPLEELGALLPEDAPLAPAELARWASLEPRRGRVVDGALVHPGLAESALSTVRDRLERGTAFVECARILFEGPLAPARPLLRSAAVTGSTAYRHPSEGDDLDLMAITRRGVVWLFLAQAFLRLRWDRAAAPPAGSHFCLNYVVDERRAEELYSHPQGFLFAREALTVQVVRGAAYYQGLLRGSAWMAAELPRLHRQMVQSPPPPEPPAPRPSRFARLASAVIFPFLATYLQLVGLRRNHLLRRAGRPEAQFAMVTRPGEYALKTERYRRLEEVYPTSSAPPGGGSG